MQRLTFDYVHRQCGCGYSEYTAQLWNYKCPKCGTKGPNKCNA